MKNEKAGFDWKKPYYREGRHVQEKAWMTGKEQRKKHRFFSQVGCSALLSKNRKNACPETPIFPQKGQKNFVSVWRDVGIAVNLLSSARVGGGTSPARGRIIPPLLHSHFCLHSDNIIIYKTPPPKKR